MICFVLKSRENEICRHARKRFVATFVNSERAISVLGELTAFCRTDCGSEISWAKVKVNELSLITSYFGVVYT